MVSCINNKLGCQAILSINELENHLENECLFKKVLGCQAILSINESENHLENESLFKKVLCPNEKCNKLILFSDIENHLNNSCPVKIKQYTNPDYKVKYPWNNQTPHLFDCQILPNRMHSCFICEIKQERIE